MVLGSIRGYSCSVDCLVVTVFNFVVCIFLVAPAKTLLGIVLLGAPVGAPLGMPQQYATSDVLHG